MPTATATTRVSRVRGTLYHSPLRHAAGDDLLPLLPWADVPHILHRGPVPLKNLRPPVQS